MRDKFFRDRRGRGSRAFSGSADAGVQSDKDSGGDKKRGGERDAQDARRSGREVMGRGVLERRALRGRGGDMGGEEAAAGYVEARGREDAANGYTR
jgi:hypothetical protein